MKGKNMFCVIIFALGIVMIVGSILIYSGAENNSYTEVVSQITKVSMQNKEMKETLDASSSRSLANKVEIERLAAQVEALALSVSKVDTNKEITVKVSGTVPVHLVKAKEIIQFTPVQNLGKGYKKPLLSK